MSKLIPLAERAASLHSAFKGLGFSKSEAEILSVTAALLDIGDQMARSNELLVRIAEAQETLANPQKMWRPPVNDPDAHRS